MLSEDSTTHLDLIFFFCYRLKEVPAPSARPLLDVKPDRDVFRTRRHRVEESFSGSETRGGRGCRSARRRLPGNEPPTQEEKAGDAHLSVTLWFHTPHPAQGFLLPAAWNSFGDGSANALRFGRPRWCAKRAREADFRA
jgi:hypothetical protein